MVDVYKNCPEYENEDYLVRMVCQEDRMDLLKVYSDKRAVPFLIVIIVAEMISIIQRKAEWNRRLITGFSSTIEKDL